MREERNLYSNISIYKHLTWEAKKFFFLKKEASFFQITNLTLMPRANETANIMFLLHLYNNALLLINNECAKFCLFTQILAHNCHLTHTQTPHHQQTIPHLKLSLPEEPNVHKNFIICYVLSTFTLGNKNVQQHKKRLKLACFINYCHHPGQGPNPEGHPCCLSSSDCQWLFAKSNKICKSSCKANFHFLHTPASMNTMCFWHDILCLFLKT